MGAYHEFLPPSQLAGDVECFWVSSPSAGAADPTAAATTDPSPHLNRVLPDGCVDIIFDLPAGTGSVIGTMTTAIVVPPTSRSLISVRFRPGAAARYLPMPVNAITDDAVSLGDVWCDGGAIAGHMSDRSGDTCGQLATLSELLLTQRRKTEIARPLQAAISVLRDSPAEASITAIASRIGFSRQHLTRKFKQLVGVGPKEFARVMRFRRLVADVGRGKSPETQRVSTPADWSVLAVTHGYFDQSHLTMEFKRLSGLTPRRYFGG